jgi:hypothetical protein
MAVFSYSKQLDAERCILAHSLNNDLTGILGRCELLGDLLLANSEAAKHLHIIRVLAHHMVDRVAAHLLPPKGISSVAGGRDLIRIVR